MSLRTMARRWKRVRATWIGLTDPGLMSFAEKRRALVSKIEERYGLTQHEAEQQVDGWLSTLSLGRASEEQNPREREDLVRH